jgi:hypothetical protein
MLNSDFVIRCSLFIILTLLCTRALPSPSDTTQLHTNDTAVQKKDSSYVTFFYNQIERFGTLPLHLQDTAITGVQVYDPLLKYNRLSASLGNIGQAYRFLVFNPNRTSSGFDYGIHTFDRYLLQNDSIKYFKVLKTFTELQYTQGAKKEIFFKASFSRNVFRSLNIGFDLRVISSNGFYLQQKTNHVNFDLTAQYFSKTKRYGVLANMLLNRAKNLENGGITYDSVFEQNLEPNRQLIAVNLSSAYNRVRESGFFMKHYFNLSKHAKHEKDTAYYSKKHVELGRLVYSFEYNRQTQTYYDDNPASGFYQNIYLDSVSTMDSVCIKKIVNILEWTNPSFTKEKKLRVFQLEARIRQQYIEVALYGQKRYFLQWIPAGGFSFHPLPTMYLYVYGDYVFGAYNKDDFSLTANLSQTLGREKRNIGTITVKTYYGMGKPGWFYEHYYSNNFRWDTAWKKQSVIYGCFDYTFKEISSGVSFSRINHYVYLDQSGLPKQETSEFGYINAYLNGSVDIWRFKFQTQLAYQTVQGTTTLKLPAFAGNLSIYYTQVLFKGAATIQPGLNFFYNTYYYGDGYIPATRSFHLQDRQEIGNYPYMDVFISVKIQRARIFLIYSHFNAGFMSRTYYMVPDYPMPDAAFKFGLTWRFFD